MQYRYTEKELDDLFDSIVLLVDSREQKNSHILNWMNEYKRGDGTIGIQHRRKKLESGDYSFFLPASREHAVLKDVYFDNLLVIERKQDLDELSGNLTVYRDRFNNEFSRSTARKFHLVIEGGSYRDICEHRYISAMTPKSYLASLLAFQEKYDIHIHFINNRHSGEFIHSLMRQFFMFYMTTEGR